MAAAPFSMAILADRRIGNDSKLLLIRSQTVPDCEDHCWNIYMAVIGEQAALRQVFVMELMDGIGGQNNPWFVLDLRLLDPFLSFFLSFFSPPPFFCGGGGGVITHSLLKDSSAYTFFVFVYMYSYSPIHFHKSAFLVFWPWSPLSWSQRCWFLCLCIPCLTAEVGTSVNDM